MSISEKPSLNATFQKKSEKRDILSSSKMTILLNALLILEDFLGHFHEIEWLQGMVTEAVAIEAKKICCGATSDIIV